MASWMVVASPIELFEHPNSDKMLLGRVGTFQVCVAKENNYEDGDIVVFAPERAELPNSLKTNYVNSETGLSYLAGPNNNRVKSIRLRGELSEGVTIPINWVLENFPQFTTINDIPMDTDLSELFGITKYEPPLPTNMQGVLQGFTNFDFDPKYIKHDVEQHRIYGREFVIDEQVMASEKLHGTCISIMKNKADIFAVTSKGYGSKGFLIEESESNLYWVALRSSGIDVLVRLAFPDQNVQLVGEVIPAQGNFTYGQTKPTVRIFRIIVEGHDISYADVRKNFPELFNCWVPILYEGPYEISVLTQLAEGKETVSGKSLHIREGIVVQPAIPRTVKRTGFSLQVKIINTKYKSKDDDLS